MTMGALRVIDLDKALASLQRDMMRVPQLTLKGLIKGGFIIQRQAQKLTPIDTGNLRASAFTIWAMKTDVEAPNFRGEKGREMDMQHEKVIRQEKSKMSTNPLKPEVEVGYTAAYAIFVHENLDARHKVGQAKFLEAAVALKAPDVVAAVKSESRKALL